MLKSISLQNFKCYKEETKFPLSKLTLFTGLNGKGKSTVLQAFLLMKQTIEHNEMANHLLLNGNRVNLGTYAEVKNAYSVRAPFIFFSFEYFIDSSTVNFVKYQLQSAKTEDLTLITKFQLNNKTFHVKHPSEILSLNDKSVVFYRLFPMNLQNVEIVKNYEMNINTTINESQFGHIEIFNRISYISASRINPENAYSLKELKPTGGQMLLRYREDKNNIEKVNAYLQEIFEEDVKVKITAPDGDPIIVRFYLNGKKYLPTNIGFGYSYILPIIIAGATAQAGEVLIIENPEAHLHPKAQSKLTEFLAKVASTGVQILIESHSDHILNALRVAVKKEVLQPEDTQVFFFAHDENSTQPKVFMPKIDKDGRIEEWPDGFFDEWNNNLMELL